RRRLDARHRLQEGATERLQAWAAGTRLRAGKDEGIYVASIEPSLAVASLPEIDEGDRLAGVDQSGRVGIGDHRSGDLTGFQRAHQPALSIALHGDLRDGDACP